MVVIHPYTRSNFFEQIPDLDSKVLIELGCGSQRPYSQSYQYCRTKQIASESSGRELLGRNVFNKKRWDKNDIVVDIDYRRLPIFSSGIFVGADTRNLPFRNETADIVGIGWLLDYWFLHLSEEQNGAQQTIAESARVLKPNGYLVGDVALHPIRSRFDKDRQANLPSDLPGYVAQAERYQELIENEGFNFLESGIGFNSDQIDEFLTFYFMAQKK